LRASDRDRTGAVVVLVLASPPSEPFRALQSPSEPFRALQSPELLHPCGSPLATCAEGIACGV
jgi:hypothetical protein